eukprot:TRINITY_DN67513_c1_g5_i1.p1 TRINITY_DN67513_c1_g5~~TRINITY_DN67513_c1_g5_i1.p1  ORF type:complete len:148 (-),score=9.25 TRINITY_DN67513_c1_g5_i1:165-608(-)
MGAGHSHKLSEIVHPMDVDALKNQWNALPPLKLSSGTLKFSVVTERPAIQRLAMTPSTVKELESDARWKGQLTDEVADIVNKLVHGRAKTDNFEFVSVGKDYQTGGNHYIVEIAAKGGLGDGSGEHLKDYFRFDGGDWYEFTLEFVP